MARGVGLILFYVILLCAFMYIFVMLALLLVLKINRVLLVLSLFSPIMTEDYCKTSSCANPSEHVMCVYNTAGPAKACTKYLEARKFDDEEKSSLLTQLNELRNNVAIGGWRDFAGLPKASNIHQLFWDRELEKFAQRLADQCATAAVQDLCRNTDTNHDVGQFVAITNDTLNEMQIYQLIIESGLQASKSKNKNGYYMEHAEKIPPELQLFVQVLWATSSKIACARATFQPTVPPDKASKRDDEPITFYVCNFGAGGSRRGRVYSVGEPCSECKCSDEYDALCASGGVLETSLLLFIIAEMSGLCL